MSSVRACVRACLRLGCFHRDFVTGASWDKAELIRFGVRRSKVKVIEWRHTELDGVRLIVSPPLWSLTELS